MGAWMTPEDMKRDFDGVAKSIRESFDDFKTAVLDRLGRLEAKDDAAIRDEVDRARREGELTGRLKEMDKRMDRYEKWLLAVGVGILLALVNWLMSWLQHLGGH